MLAFVHTRPLLHIASYPSFAGLATNAARA